jgi:hypothetical protein
MLKAAGYDVLTTVEAGRASRRLSDSDQLAFAAARGRAIYSHNVQDFSVLARQWADEGRPHKGIIVSRLDYAWRLKAGFDLLFAQHEEAIDSLFLWLPSPNL